MAYTRKCSRCGVVFERGIPTLRVVTYDRENVPLCDKCTVDLRRFLKGAVVVPCLDAKTINAQLECFNNRVVEPYKENIKKRR